MKLDTKEQLIDDYYSSFPDFQHLNIDLCLELIFPYLSLVDLVTVSDACKQMKYAAQIEFLRKYKNYKLHWILIPYPTPRTEEPPIDLSRDHEILLHGGKICFRFLRNFGHLLSKLVLYTGHWKCMEQYVNKYCADYLTHLKLDYLCSSDELDISENFQKPFPNVHCVHLNGWIRTGQNGFDYFFPKLRTLSVKGFEVKDQWWLATHFPHLENLFLYHESSYCYTKFSIDIILYVIKLNPQLRDIRLGLSLKSHPIILQTISETCKSLEKLCIWIGYHDKFDFLRFNNVRILEVWSEENVTFDAFHFDALESFYFHSMTMRWFDENFIERHPSLTKLQFYTFKNEHSGSEYMSIAFARIKEIEVFNNISAEDAVSFLDNLKSLEKLTITFKIYIERYTLAFNEFKQRIQHRQDISFEIQRKELYAGIIEMKVICKKN